MSNIYLAKMVLHICDGFQLHKLSVCAKSELFLIYLDPMVTLQMNEFIVLKSIAFNSSMV